MFGRVAGRWARSSSFVVAFAVTLGAQPVLAQSGGFPLDEPAPAAPPAVAPPPVAPQRVAPAPVPVAPAPAAPAPAAPAPSAQWPVPAAPTWAPVAPLGDPSLPALLPYREGFPVPPGYHIEKRPASGLIITGALTLSAGYVIGLGIALDKGFDGSLGWLALPVVGAWPAVAGREIQCAATTVEEAKQCLNSAQSEATTIALVAVDGMVQTTGFILFLAGLASGHPELVRDGFGDKVKVSAGRRKDGGFGVGVEGRF